MSRAVIVLSLPLYFLLMGPRQKKMRLMKLIYFQR